MRIEFLYPTDWPAALAAICVLEATRAGAQNPAMISPRSEQDSLQIRHDRVYEPYARRRTLTDAVTIAVDTRERYPYRFSKQGAETVRATVPAGDYAVQSSDGTVLAAVERKSLDNLAATLSDGTLAFHLQRLAELPLAA